MTGWYQLQARPVGPDRWNVRIVRLPLLRTQRSFKLASRVVGTSAITGPRRVIVHFETARLRGSVCIALLSVMPRNISFALTTDQIRNQQKTVTRRKGWKFLKGGETLNGCVKCMGLKPGEKVERLCQIRVVDVRIERLGQMVDDIEYGNRDAAREGFPQMTGTDFVQMFCEHMGGTENQEVTRIQFEYVQADSDSVHGVATKGTAIKNRRDSQLRATHCCASTALIERPSGDGDCFYCGSPGDVPLKLSSSFMDWYSVAQPASKVTCKGCQWMLNEKRNIAGKDKPQKTRNYGWFIREGHEPECVTKGTKPRIAEILLNPPPPRWALALPMSGQKHLLHRTPVNRSSDRHVVAIETDAVWYTVPQLIDRIALVTKVVAAIGHKGAADLSESTAIALGLSLLDQWLPVRDCPVTTLALYVTPNQKECKERCQT